MVEDPNSDEWLEIEGRSKADALERACIALNTTLAYLEYEVLGGGKLRARKLETPRKLEPEEAAGENARNGIETEDAEESAPGRFEDAQPIPADEAPSPRYEAPPLEEPTEAGIGARELLQQLLHFIDNEAKVELVETEGTIRLDILGNGSGLFIGKHGQTLEALQHLVAKMMGLDRRSGKRLTVDSERYRERRQEALEGLARKLASRAKKENRPISVEPMSAVDRRILHLALQNDRSVMTKSVGEGSGRKVVVVPRGFKGSLDEASSDTRDSRDGRRGPRRGPGGERKNGPRRGPQERPQRQRRLPKSFRLHDSFDAPPVPEHDLFQDDDDLLNAEFGMDESGTEQEAPDTAPDTKDTPDTQKED